MTFRQVEAETQKQNEVAKRMRCQKLPLHERYSFGKGYVVADDEETFSEEDMYRRILKLAFLNCAQRHHIKEHRMTTEIIEHAFATIKATTGIDDIQQIVNIFEKMEERSYSHLTFVNELTPDTEEIAMATKNIATEVTPTPVTIGKVFHQARRMSSVVRKMAGLNWKVGKGGRHGRSLSAIDWVEKLEEILLTIDPVLKGICQNMRAIVDDWDGMEDTMDLQALLTMIQENITFYMDSVPLPLLPESRRSQKCLVRLSELPFVTGEDEDETHETSTERVPQLMQRRQQSYHKPASRIRAKAKARFNVRKTNTKEATKTELEYLGAIKN